VGRQNFLALALIASSVFMSFDGMADRFRYQKSFALKVGETKSVYAVRHRDCESMPSFESLEDRLPDTDLGSFSDGGETTGKSRACDGVVPTRAIAFTATKKGEETLDFFGYRISLTVE